MRSILRSFVLAGVSLLALASLARAATASGYVDFGKFSPEAGQQFVEVELDGSLLKLASLFAAKEDAEIGRLIGSLERVRVNVMGLSAESRPRTEARVLEVRQSLVEQGWTRVVTVQEHEGADVAIFLKQGADDVVQGIVVTVMEDQKEAVLINIVGSVKLEQIAKIGDSLDLRPLRQLKVATSK